MDNDVVIDLSLSPEQTELLNRQINNIYHKLSAEAEEIKENNIMKNVFKLGVVIIALATVGVLSVPAILKKIKCLLRIGNGVDEPKENSENKGGAEVPRPENPLCVARNLKLSSDMTEHIKQMFPNAIDAESGTVWLTERLCDNLRAYGYWKSLLQELVKDSKGELIAYSPSVGDLYDTKSMTGSSLTAKCRVVEVGEPGLMKSDGKILVKALVSVQQIVNE